MKKIIVLALGLSLTAASCSLTGGSGTKGVLKSEDGGETFAPANKMAEKGEISGLTINTLSLDPVESETIFIGSASGVHKSTDGAKTWNYMLKGMRIGDIAIDPSLTSLVYASGISDQNGRIIKTQDGGTTWKDIFTEPTKNNPVLTIAISIVNSKVLLAGLNNGELIRSVDEGMTWQLVRDFTNPIIDIEYLDATTAYLLTQNNGLYVSSDQGSNWLPVPINAVASNQKKLPTSRTFYDIALDPQLKSVIFVASLQGLLRSVDSGANWSLMGLPVTNETQQVSALSVSPDGSNTMFIGVGSTIFKTTNGGVTWETRKLPTSQKIRNITISPDEQNKIYLGLGDR
jgi:photosystem II stability/assembly factor-like uncharacterized protein